MTERVYECIHEKVVEGVPYGMIGTKMNLRNWLINTGRYDVYFEEASDRAIVEYIGEFRGKYLRYV